MTQVDGSPEKKASLWRTVKAVAWGFFGVRKNNRVYPLVPYYFCSDEFAGNLTCQRALPLPVLYTLHHTHTTTSPPKPGVWAHRPNAMPDPTGQDLCLLVSLAGAAGMLSASCAPVNWSNCRGGCYPQLSTGAL